MKEIENMQIMRGEYHEEKKERGRRRRHVKEEKKALSSCLLSILQALELGHSPQDAANLHSILYRLARPDARGLISLINLSLSAGELLSKLGR